MNRGCFLFLVAFLTTSTFAEMPSGRLEIPLEPGDASLVVNYPHARVEKREGGGLRIIYTNPTGSEKSWLNIIKKFETPRRVSRMGFELKVVQNEKPVTGLRWSKTEAIGKTLESLGDVLSPYEVDFDGPALEKNLEIETPAESVNITLWVVPDPGEHVIELANWWVE
jgi:hypothetical protein